MKQRAKRPIYVFVCHTSTIAALSFNQALPLEKHSQLAVVTKRHNSSTNIIKSRDHLHRAPVIQQTYWTTVIDQADEDTVGRVGLLISILPLFGQEFASL